MANPIQKTDLITDGALDALSTMATSLSTIAENLTKAKAACQGWGEEEKKTAAATGDNVEELSKMAARITQLEDAIKKLNSAEKENVAMQKAVAAEKRKYAKLTADEAENVKRLSENVETYIRLTNSQTQSLKGLAEVYAKNIVEIDIQKKSYNELYQTYNAIKDALNRMTVEERLNTEAGKKLTEQSLKIRDTMNELQKSTGNYTLQVGKYRAAFDGLGYSFQQILREAPSALNINQFFLAISNNIPMFLDQLKAFQDEQKEIKANLAQMTEGTKEYSEQLGKVMTVGQKLAKTLLSWQSLVLVGLLIVRNWDKIVNLISKITTKTREWAKEVRNLRYEYNELDTKIRDSVRNTNLELDEIMRRLPNLSSGTTEWANAVARVNEMTGSTLTATTATVDEVGKVTQAYKEQIEQLAKNKFVIERIAESVKQSMSLDEAMKNNRSLPAIARILGLSEGSDEYKQFQERFEQYYDAWSAAPGGSQKGGPGIMRYGIRGTALRKNRYQLDEEFKKYLQDTYFKDILTEKEIESLWDKYYKPLVSGNNSGSGGSGTSEQEMNNQFWKAAEARRNIMLVGYQKELADEKAAHLQQMQEQTRANEEMQKAVEENVKNKKITKEEGARRIQELQKQNDDIMEGLILEHHKRVNEINSKYAEMDRQVIVEEELGWIEELDEAYKVDENNRRRRIKTIKDEEQSNLRITESILKMREEIEKLQEKNLTQPEAIEQRTKRIQELEKAIAKLQTQIDHTKQLSNYSSVGDIFRRNISVGAGTQQSLMESILGKDAYSAFAPGSKEMEEAIEKDFDTWIQSAEKSLSTWYSTTMGYINDLISAYVELANAKAEAAAEATEAAQEEYDKEKALLEAGYASRVEATWAEYQEKKAAQEKAEADAKAAAQAQKELNEMQTAGSMIVAAANIWKTFSGMGPVGIALAAVATAGMFAAFVASKAKAAEVSKYGEGGFEVLEGGSHASGHDIDLGVRNRRGRRMKAEGKEGIGIFSVRAMNHYGDRNIEGFVNSINRLEFEGNAAKRMSLERSVGLQMLSMPRTDLHRLESGMDKLVSYGSRNVTVLPDGTVREIRKNGVVTIKKG